ncbi:GGDEF domain-containing protein [Acidobacteria bacterium AH-259-L09]|nr:GGDEF domain-containing protein [Acidobacteria bacterium AH-259-L09]
MRRLVYSNQMTHQKHALDKRELEIASLFRGVELESVQDLLRDCPVKLLKQDEVLIHAGQPNHFLYVLLSGRLRVHLEVTPTPLAVIEPGETVGELSVIDGQPTSAQVVAAEDCRLLALDEKTLWSLVKHSHLVAYNLLSVLGERLRQGNVAISTSQQLQREYQREAVIDVLTGLYNRRWLDDMLPRHMERCKANGESLSILIIDMDNFKTYNDTYGHLAGDHLLYTIACALRESIRPGDAIARYGGDEFIALLPNADAPRARPVGERLRKAVREATGSSDWRDFPSVTISLGLAQMTAEDAPDTLIARADSALYRGKRRGRNRVTKVKTRPLA